MTETRRSPAKTALHAWMMLTILIIVSIIYIALRSGQKGFDLFIQQWPLTHRDIMLASVSIVWLTAGALLFLSATGRFREENSFTVAGFFITAFVYLNFLRERFRYGDYQYYFQAATQLYKNKHLPDSYFYPPLWAVSLQWLAPLGGDTFFLILWCFNVIALFLFYFLLIRVLERYGFTPRLAAVIVTGFMLINAPLLRTLIYVQVNLHVLNFVFLGILLYPKRPFLSALAMALAVHLKTSPIVLVLAFLLEKDWRWLAWFAFSLLVIAGITIASDGISPYLDVIHNTQALALSGDTIFHDTSFDSFMRFADPFLRIPLLATRILIYMLKAILGLGVLIVIYRSIRKEGFITRDNAGANLLNAIPPLFILMTLASPIVWEHHGIFVTLPFLLLFKRVETSGEWIWFGFAWFLQFIVPTFDFFPWSYGRLFAPLIALWLLWRTNKSGYFPYLNDWFVNLKLPSKRVHAP